MTGTQKYIHKLMKLKGGELSLLRTHKGQGIDESIEAFDLFSGLWWPLRQENQRAPRREVAWLVAKLYSSCPLEQMDGVRLALQLKRCRPNKEPEGTRFDQKVDRMMMLPIRKLEPELRWAMEILARKRLKLDWVRLTDDLSVWDRESKRLEWIEEYLSLEEGVESC